MFQTNFHSTKYAYTFMGPLVSSNIKQTLKQASITVDMTQQFVNHAPNTHRYCLFIRYCMDLSRTIEYVVTK